jgi:hypothetical protein
MSQYANTSAQTYQSFKLNLYITNIIQYDTPQHKTNSDKTDFFKCNIFT